MRLRRATPLLGAALLGALVVPGAARAACDAFTTPPQRLASVPSPEQVLGFPLGQRETTVEEIDRYMDAVDLASSRVSTGTLAVSWQGRPLRYALVSDPANVTPQGIRRVQRLMATLRDPQADPAAVAAATDAAPAILWVAGNVHGNEPTGADATLQTLYELAGRTDCAATQILDNAVVVLLPTQNPDGRMLDTRRNAYGFDMNRDWFARTQPETDGKVSALWQYPPQLFIDEHERGGAGYFFPPNADPIYHEIPDTALDWIDHLYPPLIEAEFANEGFDYFHLDVYDLFYMGYGDTVPSTGWIAAGMTYEASGRLPYAYRTREHWVSQWASLTEGALARPSILDRWHAAWVQAYQQGVAGQLEPNVIENPGHTVENPVPAITVRHYFIEDTDRTKRRDLHALIRRLVRMHVQVYRLNEPLAVPDYTPYGRAPRATTLPPGTYWIPMAQAQKHWVQAMLNETTYVPFPYFYDVTAWSQPLLFNTTSASHSRRACRRRSRESACWCSTSSRRPPPSRPAGRVTCSTRSGICRTRCSPRRTSPVGR
jgi:hypothetical protein